MDKDVPPPPATKPKLSAQERRARQEDRLAGTVFVRDAATDEPLGQLYVDVNARNSGLIGLATRGGVRERVAAAFANRVAKALAGR